MPDIAFVPVDHDPYAGDPAALMPVSSGTLYQRIADFFHRANERAKASTRSPELRASTADAFHNAAALSGSGYSDIGQGDIIGGVPKVLMGSAAGFLSPVTGATETLVEKPLTQLTGNPDFGAKAGFLAGIPELSEPAKLAMALGPGVKAASEAAKIAGEGGGNIFGDMDEALKLYHGSPKQFSDLPRAGRSGFVWWSPDEEWAANYGPNISRAQAKSLNLVDINSKSAVGAERELRRAGVDTKGLAEPFAGDAEYPAEEVHQYLANTPGLADRIRAAGYHGVNHPDIREGQGIGEAIALLPDAPIERQPLLRDVTARGRSGRPIASAPLPTGTESQILEQGYGRATEIERIKAPAIRMGNDIYEGTTHGTAADLGLDKYGDDIFYKGEDGFTTTHGRFVSREEAQKIAEAADQLKRGRGQPQLRSEYFYEAPGAKPSPPDIPASQPLLRDVTARGRSGRPIASAPLPIGTEGQILDAGYQRASAPPAAKIAGEGGTEASLPSFTAYHGSPHDFDRFDLSKIGTGEGNQAYGHGLYFAENEDVAKDYRDSLSDWSNVPSPREAALADPVLGPKLKAADEAKDYDAQAAIISEARNKYGPGKMYQVSINADPEHFLDWDKPLSEQSEHVKRAISSIVPPALTPRELLAEFLSKKAGQSGSAVMTAERLAERGSDGDIARWAAGQRQFRQSLGVRADELAENPKGIAINAALREKSLRSAGIPGIKYLDQGSRDAGDGTRNYVVFDDNLVDIVKKYGWAGLAALGYQFIPVDHDPFANGGS